MKLNEVKIKNGELLLPKKLKWILKWKYPFYSIPRLNKYSNEIVKQSNNNNRLPFFLKFDINNDNAEELILIQKSIIGGYGRLLIISENNGKYEIERIRWRRPVNFMFGDYYIDIAQPTEYQAINFRLYDPKTAEQVTSNKIVIRLPHVITKGYLKRLVYWNGEQYIQIR